MTVSESTRLSRGLQWADVAFMLWAAMFLGALGAMVQSLWVSLISAALLLGIFGAYDRILRNNTGLKRGLFAGCVLGAFVGTVGLLLGGEIAGVRSGAVLGTTLGVCLGGVIGIVSRAEFEKGERFFSKAFLFVGSIALGAFLGGAVGLFAGIFIGLVVQLPLGWLIGVLAAALVGSYLGRSFKRRRSGLIGAVIGGLITGISLLLGGAFAGLVLGAIAGCLAPMSFVALIGAVGGLSARGLKAGIVEAFEAPSEILEQGAVPFLLPAVMTGAIVGTSGSGPEGLVVITAALGLMGMLFGAFGDMNGRSGQQVTFRTVAEMAMMGVDEWPVRRVVQEVIGPSRKQAVWGGVLGVCVGLVGSGLGFGLILLLLNLSHTLSTE
ncbi:MAG: hypothetical protein IAF02_21815 [Anaerolineae bacterium]|nr:hypothetical protein [Anaerolineae bacterium]